MKRSSWRNLSRRTTTESEEERCHPSPLTASNTTEQKLCQRQEQCSSVSPLPDSLRPDSDCTATPKSTDETATLSSSSTIEGLSPVVVVTAIIVVNIYDEFYSRIYHGFLYSLTQQTEFFFLQILNTGSLCYPKADQRGCRQLNTFTRRVT